MEQIVRKATTEDVAVIAELAAKTFAFACCSGTPVEDIESYISAELSPGRFLEHVGNPSREIFIAEHDALVCGYMMLSRESVPDELIARDPLEVSRIYVAPELHGVGVAKALLDVAVARARAMDHDYLWLRVSGDNRRGVAFYLKHGFSIVGRCLFTLGNVTYEGHLMSLAVSPDKLFRDSSGSIHLLRHR